MYTNTSIEAVRRRHDLHDAFMEAQDKVVKAETKLAKLNALLDIAREAYMAEHEKSYVI